jgi:hypothetical protein
LRALGLGICGVLGTLFVFIIIRLLLVSHLQGEMLDPLGRVVRRLDLSAGASKLVWYSTFGWSAASLGLVMRRLAHLLLPLPMFRISLKDNMLLTCLFAVPLLGPDVAKKAFPVREIDPTTVAWFDESEDGSPAPHGLIGYVHEESGGWWFCNVRGGPRPTDGVTISPVSREVRREWESWTQRHREEMQKTEQAASEKAELLRLKRETEVREERQQQAAAAHAKAEADKAETARKLAEADATKQQKERIDAETRREQEKKAAAEAETKASEERLRAAQTRIINSPYGGGISSPRSSDSSQIKSSTSCLTTPSTRPAREVLVDEPLRRVSASEIPFPWRACNHCGQLPTSHIWINDRMQCPRRENCHNCGFPLSQHRHLKERMGGVINDRIACPK